MNLVTINRVSSLHEACLGGHVACAKALLENGAHVSSSPACGFGALGQLLIPKDPSPSRMRLSAVGCAGLAHLGTCSWMVRKMLLVYSFLQPL